MSQAFVPSVAYSVDPSMLYDMTERQRVLGVQVLVDSSCITFCRTGTICRREDEESLAISKHLRSSMWAHIPPGMCCRSIIF
ncbi:hypothetical protein M514_01161 [Trichuris suis]|uniref:Uncharacterized protein n=1 Tax=Trichuris suis TaxID=68888 RepID=A0A085ML32_9BILA|nr:hypothetical protein M513_01161 [Trichuris suis]KFD70893.1 hypothetical protein M514_01161 [Trichuris suis]